MLPDDVVLVALIRSPSDLERVRTEHWYRIPVRHAPKHFAGAQYLALYLTSVFREGRWSIREFAPVRGHELVRRRDLLPDESGHPRAEELYYKLEVGPLEAMPEPIVSKRGRRLLFIWTTGEKFSRARELNDLLGRGATDEALWDELKAAGLEAERQVLVREGHSRYRVDFIVHCPNGRLAISIGVPLPLRRRRGLRALTLGHMEEPGGLAAALALIRRYARELGVNYA